MQTRTGKVIYYTKKIFLPSFVYQYRSSLPSAAYMKSASQKLETLGITVLFKDPGSISFSLQSSKVFGVLSLGNLLININDLGTGEYAFSIQFATHKAIFYSVSILISFLILINVGMTGEIIKLVAIPAVFLSGHIYFFGMIPAKLKRIRSFLGKLEDEESPIAE